MAMGQMSKTITLNIKVTEILWPYEVINVLQETMEAGLKSHPDGDSWDEGPDVMIQRAQDHIEEYWNDDQSEDHIAHAFTDLMMAVAMVRGLSKPEDGK